jgi:hypothetical protein
MWGGADTDIPEAGAQGHSEYINPKFTTHNEKKDKIHNIHWHFILLSQTLLVI